VPFLNETINCEKYLGVEGQRFPHLLWSVNKGKNFLPYVPNVIGMLSHREKSRALARPAVRRSQ
jgi:hypothetical protein